MTKKVAIYARVSTDDQHPENQLLDLRRYVDRNQDWLIFKEYVDKGYSGAKDSRPALKEMMDAAQKKLFDVVLIWRFDRFSRSTAFLVNSLQLLQSKKIDFVSYQENIDTSSSMGQLFFTIIAALSQFERAIIIERVKSGLSRARQQGKHIGRPKTYINHKQLLEFKQAGLSIREISRRMNISIGSICCTLKTISQAHL